VGIESTELEFSSFKKSLVAAATFRGCQGRTKLTPNFPALASYVNSIERNSYHSPAHVPSTAIFLARVPQSTPAAFLHNLSHNLVLHDKNVILTIRTFKNPRVRVATAATSSRISERF